MVRYLEREKYEVYRGSKEREAGIIPGRMRLGQLVIKESELGGGRPFVKQVYEARLAQTSTEKNLAKIVLPFFEQQTMTDTEGEKMLYSTHLCALISSELIVEFPLLHALILSCR